MNTVKPTRFKIIYAVAAVLPAGLLTVAAPAHAAFPGANGLIAFVTDRDSPAGGPINDEIYVVDEQGSSRRLTNHPAIDSSPAMSPNGKEVAFTSDRDDAVNPNPEGDSEIYVMDLNDDDGDGNGDHLRRITNDAMPQAGLAWSPDGRKLAYTCLGGEVCVMDAEGSEPPVQLTNAAGFDGQPVFSPDGSKIAFLSQRSGGNNVYLMNADGSGQTRLTGPGQGSQPEFSPDGTRIAFISIRDGNIDVYAMRAEPESAANVPVNLTNTSSPMNARWPAWSPDGTRIAYWYGSGNGLQPDAEIYLMNADGSSPTNLTGTWGGDAFPDWGRARAAAGAPRP